MSSEALTTATSAFRELLLAYERLDSAWRRRLGIGADAKLVLAYLAARGSATVARLTAETLLPADDARDAIGELLAKDYVGRGSGSSDELVILTKRGLRARMLFDAVIDDLVAEVDAGDTARRSTILEFISEASASFTDETQTSDPP